MEISEFFQKCHGLEMEDAMKLTARKKALAILS